jgi:uncharacterized FAD-dependent dehydrogenase
MSKVEQFSLPFNQDLDSYVKSSFPSLLDYRLLSKSLDARNAPRGKKPIYNYKIEIIKQGESFSKEEEVFEVIDWKEQMPIIVGAGPAGLFSALRFAQYNIPCIIIERGEVATKRMLHISKYWRRGEFNPESNVCYGEGGAGLFSDGKLITRVKSPYVKYVMNQFVRFGAPAEVGYISNPHLGSNKIRTIITKISDYLIERGFKFYYNTRVDEVLFEKGKAVGVLLNNGEKLFSSNIILGTGHSAKEMYIHLDKENVSMKQKDIAVGVRIEHKRELIDSVQHGRFAGDLDSARYKLNYYDKESNKGTYSFCMCPGGYVLSSGTDSNGIVANGMSNYARNSPWSNSAIVVTVHANKDYPGEHILAGIEFQESIEQKAYELSVKYASGKELPAITVGEFLSGRLSESELPKTSCPSKLFKADFNQIFPKFIINHLKKALLEFDKKMKGFVFKDALLIAPETRTSAPITILRDKESLESVSHSGLYPCGEGAGHAGGITSAAVDGVKVTEAIIHKYRSGNV